MPRVPRAQRSGAAPAPAQQAARSPLHAPGSRASRGAGRHSISAHRAWIAAAELPLGSFVPVLSRAGRVGKAAAGRNRRGNEQDPAGARFNSSCPCDAKDMDAVPAVLFTARYAPQSPGTEGLPPQPARVGCPPRASGGHRSAAIANRRGGPGREGQNRRAVGGRPAHRRAQGMKKKITRQELQLSKR